MNAKEINRFAHVSLHISPKPMQIPECDIWVVMAIITPKQAEDWLDKFNPKNRKVRINRARQFAADMKSKRWYLTHQGIAFDVNGEMVSGQHRLLACIASGMRVHSLVFLNCPEQERRAIDQTYCRTVSDLAQLAHNDRVSSLVVATSRAMAYGWRGQRGRGFTHQEIYEFIERYREPLETVLQAVKKKVRGVTTAPVLAAVARAAVGHQKTSIRKFCELLVDGMATAKCDKPAIQLRNWLLENASQPRGGMEWRSRIYRRTESAVSAYLTGKGDAMVDAKSELFPLAGEKFGEVLKAKR